MRIHNAMRILSIKLLPTLICLLGPLSGFSAGTLPYQSYVAEVFPNANPSSVPAAQNSFTKSVEALLTLTPKTIAGQGAGALSYDCVALAALIESGMLGTGATAQSAKVQLAAVANALIRPSPITQPSALPSTSIMTLINNSDGPIGWGVPEGSNGKPITVFDSATPDPVNTVYSVDTGVALACLAKSAIILGNDTSLYSKAWLTTAQTVFSYWQQNLSLPASSLCNDCFYYRYSNNGNSEGRYVRNTNVAMALGAATLAKALAATDPVNAKIAQTNALQTWRSEVKERSSAALGYFDEENRGYLGKLDPEWINNPKSGANNIEHHMPFVAVVLAELDNILGSTESGNLAMIEYNDWTTCTTDLCKNETSACNVWAGDARKCQATVTAAHCAFVNLGLPSFDGSPGAKAEAQCVDYLSKATYNQPFGIWAEAIGYKSFLPKYQVKKCPAGQVMSGTDSSGNLVCSPLNFSLKSCDSTSGKCTPSCGQNAGSRQVIGSFAMSSIESPTFYQMEVCKNTGDKSSATATNTICAAGENMVGLDSAGRPICDSVDAYLSACNNVAASGCSPSCATGYTLRQSLGSFVMSSVESPQFYILGLCQKSDSNKILSGITSAGEFQYASLKLKLTYCDATSSSCNLACSPGYALNGAIDSFVMSSVKVPKFYKLGLCQMIR